MANQGGSHEQHVKAGQQSHKNQDKGGGQQAGGRTMPQQEGSGDRQQEGGASRGGTHEQHVRAGEQSHKNK